MGFAPRLHSYANFANFDRNVDCRYADILEELCDLFVLGTLPPDEDILVRQHLDRHCPHCQASVRRSAVTVYALLEACRPVKLIPKKAELLHRLQANRA